MWRGTYLERVDSLVARLHVTHAQRVQQPVLRHAHSVLGGPASRPRRGRGGRRDRDAVLEPAHEGRGAGEEDLELHRLDGVAHRVEDAKGDVGQTLWATENVASC